MNSYSIKYLYNSNLNSSKDDYKKICCKYDANTYEDRLVNKSCKKIPCECNKPVECNCEDICDCKIDLIDEEPGKPYISYRINSNNDILIEITMPYGELADYWKLFEGNVLVCEGKIHNKYNRPQKIVVEAKNVIPDIYNYRCKMINECGQTKSESIVIDTRCKHINYPEKFKASMYSEDLVLLTWNKECEEDKFDIEINGRVNFGVKPPFSFRCNENNIYNFRIRRKLNDLVSSWSRPEIISTYPRDNDVLNKRIIIGYWNNYDNHRNIKLRGISKEVDIVNVAFADLDIKECSVKFKPKNQTVDEFISDIKYLQVRKQKVCISLGGEFDCLSLNTKVEEDRLFNSLQEVIKVYGFNGIDVRIRGNCLSLIPGDIDFKNPKTPVIIHLINVIKRLVCVFGKNFILTISPDVNYVQGASVSYKYTNGAYLPIIHALREELTLIYTPSVNTKTIPALDGVIYNQNTIDFHIAMIEMLLRGFNIEGDEKNSFAALPEKKVLLGLDCSIKATCCKNLTMLMEKAFNALILGDSIYEDYDIFNKKGYKDIKGVVGLSLNWGDDNDLKFLREAKYYLDNI